MSRIEPTLVVLGVYKPEIPDAVYQEEWRVAGSDQKTATHFEKLVLIEAVLANSHDRFHAIELGQSYQDHFP